MSFHPLKEIQDLTDSDLLAKRNILDYITCSVLAKNTNFDLCRVRDKIPSELDSLIASIENNTERFMTSRDTYHNLCLRAKTCKSIPAYSVFPICIKPCPISVATRIIECFDLDSSDARLVQVPFVHDESVVPSFWYDFGKFVKPWDPTSSHMQASQNLPNCVVVHCDDPSLVARAHTSLFLVVVAKSCSSFLTAVIRHQAPGVLGSTNFAGNPHEFWSKVGPYASFPTTVTQSRSPRVVLSPIEPPAALPPAQPVLAASSKRAREYPEDSENSDPDDNVPIGELFTRLKEKPPRQPVVVSRGSPAVVAAARTNASVAQVPVVVVADVKQHRTAQRMSQVCEDLAGLLPQLHALLRPNMRRDGNCWRFREYWDYRTGRLEPVPPNGAIPDPTSSTGFSIPLHDGDLVQVSWIHEEDAPSDRDVDK